MSIMNVPVYDVNESLLRAWSPLSATDVNLCAILASRNSKAGLMQLHHMDTSEYQAHGVLFLKGDKGSQQILDLRASEPRWHC